MFRIFIKHGQSRDKSEKIFACQPAVHLPFMRLPPRPAFALHRVFGVLRPSNAFSTKIVRLLYHGWIFSFRQNMFHIRY